MRPSSPSQQLTLALGTPGANGILFDIDSEGGEVNGMLDNADLIFNARSQKPIWAVGNDCTLDTIHCHKHSRIEHSYLIL